MNGRNASLWSCEDWESLIELPLNEVRKKIKSRRPDLYHDILQKLSTHNIDLNNNQVLVN